MQQHTTRFWVKPEKACLWLSLPWYFFSFSSPFSFCMWCAACTVCQSMHSDYSRLEINDWFWLGRISWSDSSHSYNNGYIGPRQCVWGAGECIFKYNSSILEWKMCILSSWRQYQRGQQESCATPCGAGFFFHWSLNEGPGLHVSASPSASSRNPCDGLTSPPSYCIATTRLWLPS